MKNNKLNFWVYFVRFLSGFLNAGMLLSVDSVLSLHTVNLTQTGMYLVSQEWNLIVFPVVAIISYFLGSMTGGAYYGKLSENMSYTYWRGYLAVAFLLSLLWIPALSESAATILILSFSMGIIASMALDNHGYIGTITLMTGLLTSLAKETGYWLFRNQTSSKEQVFYLSKNLIAYILGAIMQMLLYLWLGRVLIGAFVILTLFITLWSYRYGKR